MKPQSSPSGHDDDSRAKVCASTKRTYYNRENDLAFRIRLADCVGYVIDGVRGYEDEKWPKQCSKHHGIMNLFHSRKSSENWYG